MKDAELFALSALLMAGAVDAAGENELRRMQGEVPAHMDGSTFDGPIANQIKTELKRREREREDDRKRGKK